MTALLRSASLYIAAILAEYVTINPLYLPKDGLTHCNQFVRAVLKTLGIEIPALLANDLYDWFLGVRGWTAGWKEIMVEQAVQCANLGQPVVAIWKNLNGPHGHVVLIKPSTDGAIHTCQAGAVNFENGTLGNSFGKASPVRFLTHA